MKKGHFLKSRMLVKLLILAIFFCLANCKSFNLYIKWEQKMKHEDYDAAIKYYNSSLEIDSIQPSIYRSRAYCYLKKARFYEALLDINKYISIKMMIWIISVELK